MKNLIILAVFITALFGCSKTEEIKPTPTIIVEKPIINEIPSKYRKYLVFNYKYKLAVLFYNDSSKQLTQVEFLENVYGFKPKTVYYKVVADNMTFYLEKNVFDNAKQDYSIFNYATNTDKFSETELKILVKDPFNWTETDRTSDYTYAMFRKYTFTGTGITYTMESRWYKNYSGYFYNITTRVNQSNIEYKQF